MPTPSTFRFRRSALAAVLAAASVAVAAVALRPAPSVADADGTDAATAAAIEQILADPDLPRAFWGIVVVDVRSGRTVATRNGDLNLMPASTLKLFTTAAALDALGADFRYTTGLYHLGPDAAGGTLRGDLVIRGVGDPTFGSSGQPDPLARWAQALADAGVRRIEGRLVGDDDRFEDALYAEGWDVRHIATESYAPAAGGLAWADNLIPLQITGRSGRPTLAGGPDGFATVDVEPREGRSTMRVERALGTDQFRLTGSVASGYRGTLRLPVANPTLYAVYAFADALREAGIDVSALQPVDVDDLAAAPAYDDAAPLLVHVSPPLAAIVARTNQESDNLYAEYLFRTLAADGSTEAAARRVEAFLQEAGADTEGLSLVDGSGLSRKDLITPNAMAALLRHMARHRDAAVFRASLASGGGAGSTLRNRLDGVPVHAKTGSLSAVRCLSGYVDGPGGAPMAFVLMANHFTVEGRRIAEAQDRIVRAIATGGRLPVDETD